MSGELRVARRVPGHAEVVGVRRGTANAAWPCRARPCTRDVAMPLASYLGRRGRAPSGACRRPSDQRLVLATLRGRGRRVGHGGRAEDGGKKGRRVEGRRGRHGHGHAMSGPLLVFPWHGLGVVVSKDQC